ncbi:unnamed protein product [Caenorhabditis bovis]|uniref:FHA domain-containing protein n=1 Tax=Caenorhabditis bovis TaxID=2654633 RepID=A0A8S1F2X3_9PELO|nr:unnamed protein product [Caenorhabditis bovis]
MGDDLTKTSYSTRQYINEVAPVLEALLNIVSEIDSIDGNEKQRKRTLGDDQETPSKLASRRSTREIKRPKFDDELVDSSARMKRYGSRERSQTQCTESTPGPDDSTSSNQPGPSNSKNEKRKSSLEKGSDRSESRSSKKANEDDEDDEAETVHLREWPVVDDVIMATAMTHMKHAKAIYQTVRFSRNYTLEEVENRWFRLLYDEPFLEQCKKRFGVLSPEQILHIQARTPLSVEEDEFFQNEITAIEKVRKVTIADCALILDNNSMKFHPCRTPQFLLDYYRGLKNRNVTNNVNWIRIEKGSLNNSYSLDYLKPIRRLESRMDKLRSRPALDLSNLNFSEKLHNSTLAIIRGRFVKYTVRFETTTIGRNAPSMLNSQERVDIDLSIEGPASKISRKQAILELDKEKNEFKLTNTGQRAIFVDGKPVPMLMSTMLKDHSIIEIASIRLLFKRVCPAEMDPRVKQVISQRQRQRQQLQIPQQLLARPGQQREPQRNN